ncbi:GNAT family N-acetyltransferase [Cellulosimicrobium sp. NPDC057127]|uniref:GNAT family N-acetyltransferase n=1 Tax=Cellulosimicrobium sp. NPDC057127 TaxID=3346026 RepID=UPI00362CC9FF
MSAVRSRTLPVRDVGAADLARWRDLAAHPLEASVFATPDFLVPTVEHLDHRGGVRLVVVEDGDRWLAVLPFEKVPPSSRWPLPHASTDGPVLNLVTSLGSPLVRADGGAANLRLLAGALRRHARELGGALDMVYAVADGPVGGGLRRALEADRLAVHEWGRDERAAADLDVVRSAAPGTFPHLTTSRNRDVRRRARRLGEELGTPVELAALALEQVDDAKAFLDFEQHSWKSDAARDGVGLSRLHGGTGWFRDVYSRFAAHGDASVAALRVGGETLYMSSFLRHGDVVFGWYDEYADRWARYAPGVLGRLLGVRHVAATTTASGFDTCMHPSLYPEQNELFPHRRTIVSYTVALHRGPASWLLRAIPLAGRVRRRLVAAG